MPNNKTKLANLIRSQKLNKLIELQAEPTAKDYLVKDKQGNNIILLCCKFVIENKNNEQINIESAQNYLHYLIYSTIFLAKNQKNFSPLFASFQNNNAEENLLNMICKIDDKPITRIATQAIEFFLLNSKIKHRLKPKILEKLENFIKMANNLFDEKANFTSSEIEQYGTLALDYHLKKYGINNISLIAYADENSPSHYKDFKGGLKSLAAADRLKIEAFAVKHKPFIDFLFSNTSITDFFRWFNNQNNNLTLDFFQIAFSNFFVKIELNIDHCFPYFEAFFNDLNDLYFIKQRIDLVENAISQGYVPEARHLYLDYSSSEEISLPQHGCTNSADCTSSSDDSEDLVEPNPKKIKINHWQNKLNQTNVKKSFAKGLCNSSSQESCASIF